MSIIYQPKGRAKEYCEQAANLYRGCGHGCVYCYAPNVLKVDREKFFGEPEPRPNVMPGLIKDAMGKQFKGPVLLCFSCDPYQPINEFHQLTGQAIKHLKANGIPVEILTKGGRRAEVDFHMLDSGDKVGATLTFVNKADSLEWEPGAALPWERFEMLETAKRQGIQTWASLEPVIDPEQSLEIIRRTHTFVDMFKVGKLNYHPRATVIDWREFVQKAVKLLEGFGCRYYIKEDLRRYLKESCPICPV